VEERERESQYRLYKNQSLLIPFLGHKIITPNLQLAIHQPASF
jgi:hypothetical protein